MRLEIDSEKRGTALPRIMKASVRLFVKKGIDGTTIKDIARAADVSEGALYRHFAGKDELAADLFERNRRSVTERVQARVDAAKGARAKLSAYVAAIFEEHDADPELFYFLLVAEHRELGKLAASGDHPGLLLERVLAEGQRAGEIREGALQVLASVYLGTLHRLCVLRRYEALSGELSRRVDETSDLLWSAVKARGAA